jgi:hypothetical protein
MDKTSYEGHRVKRDFIQGCSSSTISLRVAVRECRGGARCGKPRPRQPRIRRGDTRATIPYSGRRSSEASGATPRAPDAPVLVQPGYSRRAVSPSMPVAPSKIMLDNNIVEQDHCSIKRIMRPMLGFKSMHSARILLAGIETMHMIRKGQLGGPKGKVASAAKQFYSLAF